MQRTICLDTETFYDTRSFSVKDLGYYKYTRDPRFNCYLISVCDGTESWAGRPADFNFKSLRGHNLVSWNSAFDEEVALSCAERGEWTIPGIKPLGMDFWYCGANMAAYLWNRRSLADACDIGLGIALDKGVRDKANGKQWDDIVREGWAPEMIRYGQLDAQRGWQLWDKYSPQWPEFERELSRLTIDQGRHGVRLDVVALDEGIVMLQKVIFQAEQNLPWVKRGRAPASPIGIAEECRNVGIPAPPVKKNDPDGAEEWELQYAHRYPFIMAIRNIRKSKKGLASLLTLKGRLKPDETVDFSLMYAGAHTLRWSGGGGFNMQNMPKLPYFVKNNEFILNEKEIQVYASEFATIPDKTAYDTLPSGVSYFDMRGVFIAREGMVLAPVDESQIEPRVLNWLAQDSELLAKIRAGLGIYDAHVRATMPEADDTPSPLKKNSPKIYALAKARVLGAGYGCGWEKFITVAWTMAQLDITEGDEDFALAVAIDKQIHHRVKFSETWYYETQPPGLDLPKATLAHQGERQPCVFVKKLKKKAGVTEEVTTCLPVYGMRSRVTIDSYRASNVKIVALWELLDTQLKASEGGDFIINGPHGGQMIYKDVRRERRIEKNKDTGEKYEKTVYTAETGGKRRKLWGSLITENVTQWVSRMIFAERMLALHKKLQAEDPRQRVLFSVHDEAIAEIIIPQNKEVRLKEIESLMAVAPSYMPDLPLAAEGSITPRYLK